MVERHLAKVQARFRLPHFAPVHKHINQRSRRPTIMSNRKAAETLGMPQGTASNRLRKMLLFRQLKKHGENVCVRCEQPIEQVEDLSVEHIQPWEGRSADLFWDLDNVAFSHLKCNVRHGGTPVIPRPLGQEWCSNCKSFKSIIEFDKCSTNPRGVDRGCKTCKSKRNALRDRRKILPGAPDGRAPLS